MDFLSGPFFWFSSLILALAVFSGSRHLGMDLHQRKISFFTVLVAAILLNGGQQLMEGGDSAEELIELLWDWNFVNIGVAAFIVLAVGTGAIRTKYKGFVWGLSIAVLWAALHVGIGRHEWGEVFFNGTLL